MIGLILAISCLGSVVLFRKLHVHHPQLFILNVQTAIVGFIFLIPISSIMIYYNIPLPVPNINRVS